MMFSCHSSLPRCGQGTRDMIGAKRPPFRQSIKRTPPFFTRNKLHLDGKWIASFYQKYPMSCFTRREIYNNAGRTDEPIPLHSSSNNL